METQMAKETEGGMSNDQSLVSFARSIQEAASLRKELAASNKRIAELEDWIKAEGEHNDTCTYAILNKVCDGCRCERMKK